MANAMVTLWKEGGVPRFYKGVSFAIIQNPMSRFGDTAANTGVLAVMDVYFPEAPMALKTALASVGGATWRILLTPVDTFKTTLQVQGNTAFNLLRAKVAAGGIGQLYGGASANFVANWVGNYPWCASLAQQYNTGSRAPRRFVTFNFLQAKVPKYTDTKKKLLRNAAIGIAASAVSDTVSNSLRVIKTVKQTNADASLGYVGVIKSILAKDGMKGLFGRGLSTRLITNMAQSMVFSVGWKAIEVRERRVWRAPRFGLPSPPLGTVRRCSLLASQEELNARAARADAKKAADEAAAAATAAAAKGGKKGGKSGSITAVRGLAGSKLVSA